MEKFLWEIWVGKKNIHFRIEMNFNESPQQIFKQIQSSSQGTDNEIPIRAKDPNTGQEVDLKWRYAWRNEGTERKLQPGLSFAQQGVNGEPVFVVRMVELRANTIYVDGIDGLGADELAGASNKTPWIILGILLIAGIGYGAYYYVVLLPHYKAIAPHVLRINTLPKGSKVSIALDLRKAKKKSMESYSNVTAKDGTPAKLAIPKGAIVIGVTLSADKYTTWSKGVDLETWQKDQAGKKKLKPIPMGRFLSKSFFPKSLKKAPPPRREPPLPRVAGPKFAKAAITYPRRWPRRGLRVGLDPMHGGEKTGVTSIQNHAASQINLLYVTKVAEHLSKQRKRRRKRYKVYSGRTKKDNLAAKKRLRNMRRAKDAIIQFDFAVGYKEFKKGNKKKAERGQIFHYNDSVGGFKIYWSEKKRRSLKKTVILAKCMAEGMLKAGFVARTPMKDEKVTDAKLGIRPLAAKEASPILEHKRVPGIRVILGYLSHTEEEKAFTSGNAIPYVAQAVESALVCLKSTK